MSIGSLEQAPEGPRVRFTRHFRHSPEKVWRAITEPEHMAAWFPDTVRLESWTVGAPLRFERPPGMGDPIDGEVLAVEAGKLLEFRWGTDILRFEVEPDGQGTKLTLLDQVDQLGRAVLNGAGWHMCLEQLEAHLEGGQVSWSMMERWKEIHPSYVESFGPEAATIGPPAEALP